MLEITNTQVKKFNTKFHKQISLFKQDNVIRVDVHLKLNGMKLFSGHCQQFAINHASHHTSIPTVISIEFIRQDNNFASIIVKGKCQIRFINNKAKMILESHHVRMKSERIL
jgi:hypothetical protein